MNSRLLYVLAAIVAVGGVFVLKFLSETPAASSPEEKIVSAQATSPQPSSSEESSPASTPVPTPNPEETSKNLVQRIQAELSSNKDPDSNIELKKLLDELVKIDPQAAAHLAESIPPGPLRGNVMRRVAQDWAVQDPQGAENWAGQLHDPDERIQTLSQVCYQVAQASPAQAVQDVQHLELKEQKNPVLYDVAQQWAAKDYPAAYAWASQQPPGEEKDQLMSRMVYVQSQTDPENAAKTVVEQISPGTVQTEAAITVIYQWAKTDMPGATAWVETFPPGPLRDRAEKELAGIAMSQKQ